MRAKTLFTIFYVLLVAGVLWIYIYKYITGRGQKPHQGIVQLKLTDKQIEKIADILSNLGYIAFAGTVLPAILQKATAISFTAGIVSSLLCWTASLLTLGKLKNI